MAVITSTSNSDRPAKRWHSALISLTPTTQRWPTVGQFRLGCSAVHRSALLKPSHRTALRTLRSAFKELMASISASVKSNELQSRLDRSLSLLFVLGMTAIPLCVAQRRRTWAGSVHSLSSSHTHYTRFDKPLSWAPAALTTGSCWNKGFTLPLKPNSR